ncbi:endonuclease 4 [subsurface metagenome]
MGFAYGIPQTFSDEIITLSKQYKVTLSCHLPFWINLGNSDEEKNINYLISGLKIADRLGAVVVFHLGFYGNKKFDELRDGIVNSIQTALNKSNIKEGKLGIETTGKQKAIGTCDEIVELIKIIDNDRVIPIIDWSHVYARNNGTLPHSCEDFTSILKKFEDELGHKPFYFHGGGIEYKNGNEVRHISSKTYEPPLPYLFAALHDLGYKNFTFIVESPDSIEDVKLLKQIWQSPEDYFDAISPTKVKSLFDFGVK